LGVYLSRLGLTYAAIAYVTNAGPADATWLSAADANELGIVQAAKRLSEEKHRSLREISAALEAQGFVAKSGKPFAADVVGGMLAVSWTDVERGIVAYEARKQAA
jgi:hypothetical protein